MLCRRHNQSVRLHQADLAVNVGVWGLLYMMVQHVVSIVTCLQDRLGILAHITFYRLVQHYWLSRYKWLLIDQGKP